MRRFTELFLALDATTRTNEKLAVLERYFAVAAPRDAAWALYFLSGGTLSRAVSTRHLREWTAAEAALPLWLVEECYDAVGDLGEALALLFPEGEEPRPPSDVALADLVEGRILPLKGLAEDAKRDVLLATWRELDRDQRLVWNKLITGSFRVGVARTLVVRALAAVVGVESAVLAHRLTGTWEPTAESYERLVAGDAASSLHARPYPFFLAHALEDDAVAALGDLAAWQVEWKWDGIRAQLVARRGETCLWSRGEELITERFPEIARIGAALSAAHAGGTVLDGEILGWRDGRPLAFLELQKRIGRHKPGAKLLAEVPATFVAYDLLEEEGFDLRFLPLAERRARLEALVATLPRELPIAVSEMVPATSPDDLETLRVLARERGVEGLMIKRKDSAYGVGRVRGPWWKWKVDPFAVDAVLIYAQRGHGRRASLYTDYTFGVWRAGELVPFAKAYSGLSDAEIRQVDAHIRKSTIERHGPVRVVRPELVFELHFEAIQPSARHKSGVAVRFPRIARWRRDKLPAEADTIETLQALVRATPASGEPVSSEPVPKERVSRKRAIKKPLPDEAVSNDGLSNERAPNEPVWRGSAPNQPAPKKAAP
jgi:DNA ligase-1